MFISHAGPQKGSFAVWLQRELRRHGVSAFLDETSLRLGDAADAEMEAARRTCSIVVVVLTPDFLCSSYCMGELHWAQHPTQSHRPLRQSHAASAALQSATGSPPHLQPDDVTVQRSKAPPLLLPVFLRTSDIAALQKLMLQHNRGARKRRAPAAELHRLQQASEDLDAVCRSTGDRLDSHGK